MTSTPITKASNQPAVRKKLRRSSSPPYSQIGLIALCSPTISRDFTSGERQTAESCSFFINPWATKWWQKTARKSRYSLSGNESGFLIDVVDPGWISKHDNQSTIKQLALGSSATGKISGSTQDVRGFIAITSNFLPDYLVQTPRHLEDFSEDSEERRNDENNRNAWRRRFLTVHFVDPVDLDPFFIDKRASCLRCVAAVQIKKSLPLFGPGVAKIVYGLCPESWSLHERTRHGTIQPCCSA